MKATLEIIRQRIEKLAQSERVTKVELSAISRELLEYVIESGDVQPVNELLRVLTPMNKQTAVLFFQHFLPFKFVEDQVEFGGKIKRQWDIKVANITVFLEDEDNDIWKWAAENIKVEKKPVDFAKNISKWVGKALNDEENPLEPVDVMKAVIDGGLSQPEMLELLAQIAQAAAEEEKEGNGED